MHHRVCDGGGGGGREEEYLWMRCSLNCRLVDVDYDRLRLGSVAVSTNVFVIYR